MAVKCRDLVDFPEYGKFGIRPKSRAARVLTALKEKKIVSNDDYLWFKTRMGVNDCIKQAFYNSQGSRALIKYGHIGNAWLLNDAIVFFRKAGNLKQALELIEQNDDFVCVKDVRLRSGLLTSSGAVLKDCGQFDKAIRFGKKAYSLHESYSSCTLVGSCYVVLGRVSDADKWFKQAKMLGCSSAVSVSSEYKRLYLASNGQTRMLIKKQMLKSGVNFDWMEK
ncbi:hypothetical protein [Photobacterium leiognathi]|uniref:hypothetical protein n=1 Tax=Photobacterium leiognathi TaxID=553611 RepID=UPI0029825E6E|nr:hypothetical protein [Photobacterium leiognathi]